MKKFLRILLLFIIVLVLGVGGYCGYILLSYKRIGDTPLSIDSKTNLTTVKVNEVYSASTYNIGFGAYSQDFTFFLDTAYDINGEPTSGYYSKAKSEEEVYFNVNGAKDTLKDLNVDFAFIQEVDIKSTRSHHINQNDILIEGFLDYDNVFAYNFDTAFLPYPFYDMHGKSLGGISTFSKYKIESAERVEYTVSDTLSKLFDLDRCFSVSKVKVDNGKYLYLINSHMSAYDEGGLIRKKQIDELNNYLTSILNEGNYVVVGGDFNHDLLTYNPDYNYDKQNRPFNNVLKDPDWVHSYFLEDKTALLVDGFKVVASDNIPSCRNCDIEWIPDLSFKSVVDGFIVSNNIEVIDHYNIETRGGNKGINGFSFSDHEPCYLEFKLL